MSTATTFPRPAADFTFYVYADRAGHAYARPGRTPDEAWQNVEAMVRASYTPGHPHYIEDLREYFGHEPTAGEIEAEVRSDLAHYVVLLTVSAPSQADAYKWWRQGEENPELLEVELEAPPAAGEA